MMMLLPGSRPQDVTSSPTPVSKKISDATQSSVKTEDEEESEYTYETGKHGRKICYALYIRQCVYWFFFFNFRFPFILITTKILIFGVAWECILLFSPNTSSSNVFEAQISTLVYRSNF